MLKHIKNFCSSPTENYWKKLSPNIREVFTQVSKFCIAKNRGNKVIAQEILSYDISYLLCHCTGSDTLLTILKSDFLKNPQELKIKGSGDNDAIFFTPWPKIIEKKIFNSYSACLYLSSQILKEYPIYFINETNAFIAKDGNYGKDGTCHCNHTFHSKKFMELKNENDEIKKKSCWANEQDILNISFKQNLQMSECGNGPEVGIITNKIPITNKTCVYIVVSTQIDPILLQQIKMEMKRLHIDPNKLIQQKSLLKITKKDKSLTSIQIAMLRARQKKEKAEKTV